MKLSLVAVPALLSLSLACVAPVDGKGNAAPAPSAAPVSSAALAIEQAARDLDVGKDAASARTKLEEALRDPALPEATRDTGTLALARALDASGDKEQAIRAVEALVAKHVDDHPWGLEEQADELLQKLVTGSVQHVARDDANAVTPAPVAFALAKYFPVKDGKVRINFFSIGGSSATSERLGTFAIGDALRAKKREACPLCDDKIGAHTFASRSETWTRIPAERAKYDDALVVFYFDLGARRIPARYDELLPMPSADVAARLEKGEGLVAIKHRNGAPPIVLLAAPRDAQLGDVEEAFARMKELPTEPVAVQLTPQLRREEILSVMRSARPAVRSCADALISRVPGSAGTVTVSLKVRGDGMPSGIALRATPALEDKEFLQCVEKAVGGLSFPKSGSETNVTYPLVVTAS